MHQHTESINSPNVPAPRFSQSENVARTMSSREIAELTGKRHFHVTTDIEKMLTELKEDATGFRAIYLDRMNRQQTEYLLDREHTDCLLTGYSAAMRMTVIRRWHELESQVAQTQPLSTIEILQIAMESEKARLMLTAQVEQQCSRFTRVVQQVHPLVNLLHQGVVQQLHPESVTLLNQS